MSDRDGRAPAAWIEQLVGRRSRFGFNKVMAVSTTGFAPGALEYANVEGIELRTLADMKLDQLPAWLVKEYRRDDRDQPISQSVSFPVEFHGGKFALEMHNLADTGETHILLRKLS